MLLQPHKSRGNVLDEQKLACASPSTQFYGSERNVCEPFELMSIYMHLYAKM